jgi:hypothetical protein
VPAATLAATEDVMIKHIVMWKLKDQDRAGELVGRLEALKTLPSVGALEAGINASDRPVAWDVVLVSAFADAAALDAYRVHPDHQEVVALLGEIAAETAVVDYEI